MELFHRLRSDEALMLRYGEGDVGAFDTLYRRHKDPLFNFLVRSGCPDSRAEDIAQETWSAVIRAADRYRVEASFKTWLYTIARRKLVDEWRRCRGDTDVSDDCEQESADVDRGMIHVETSRLLALLETLPDEQREAFLLKEEGFSLQEIAEMTQAGLETARSRLRYARASLRAGMGVERHA